MSLTYWVFLVAYLMTAGCSFFLVGVNWCKIETKNKTFYSPQLTVAVIYILNFLILNFAFEVPYWVQFIIYVLNVISVYMGTFF